MTASATRARLEAAARALAEAGERPTVAALAREAGVTRGTVYRHLGGAREVAAAAGAPTLDQRILDGLDRLFRERGPAAVSLADVAQEAGVSPASVYRRFGSRQGLLSRYAVEQGPRGLAAGIAGAAGDLDDGLLTFAEAAILFLRDRPGLARALARPDAETAALLGAPTGSRSRDHLGTFLRRHAAEGRLAVDPDLLAGVLLASCVALHSALSENPAEGARALVSLVLDGARG